MVCGTRTHLGIYFLNPEPYGHLIVFPFISNIQQIEFIDKCGCALVLYGGVLASYPIQLFTGQNSNRRLLVQMKRELGQRIHSFKYGQSCSRSLVYVVQSRQDGYQDLKVYIPLSDPILGFHWQLLKV